MDTNQLMALGLAAGILFGAYKYGDAKVKGMALGVAGVIIAKRIPYVQDVLA